MTPAEIAYRDATRAEPSQMAQELQEILGQRSVAFAAGVQSPQAVGRWAAGKAEPQGEAEPRLRNLYKVVLVLRETESPQTIRAWLQGANPHLAHRAPLEVLREDDLGADAAAVVDAAVVFADA